METYRIYWSDPINTRKFVELYKGSTLYELIYGFRKI